MSSSNTSAGAAANPPIVSGEERQAFAKLEALKEIRSKTIALEKLRLRLLHDVDAVENEEKCLAEFRREMELLQQEKMAHVEELRQIHADINAMETVMKQAEEAKRQANESARRILEDYSPLKHDVDLMRVELLGLEKLPDLPNEDKERLGSIGLLDKPKSFDPHHVWHRQSAMDAAAAEKAAAGFFGLRGPGSSGSSSSSGHPINNPTSGSNPNLSGAVHHHHPNPFLAAAAAQHSAMGLGPLGPLGAKADQLRTSLTAQAVGSGPPPAPFRQQPPPMKSCLSCHQQIHRNAPICPLCKAKSRSRNPKKPKKKD